MAVSTARGYEYTDLGDAGGWDNVDHSPTTYVLDRGDYTVDLGITEAQVTTTLTNAFDTWSSAPLAVGSTRVILSTYNSGSSAVVYRRTFWE